MNPVWDYLSTRNLIDLQRLAAVNQMGEQARQLLAEGYPADADRILDEINERKRQWQNQAA